MKNKKIPTLFFTKLIVHFQLLVAEYTLNWKQYQLAISWKYCNWLMR